MSTLRNVAPIPQIVMVDNQGVLLLESHIRDARIEGCTQTQAAGVTYVTWTLQLTLSSGTTLTLHKRYSEFIKLRQAVVHTVDANPNRRRTFIPSLSSTGWKDLRWKTLPEAERQRFLDRRMKKLQGFVSVVFLDPEMSGLARRFASEGGSGRDKAAPPS